MAHVLVVDDEPALCWAMEGFLSDEGHRVSVAGTAEQAIARAETDPADVLFLDVRLPGMDGLSALETLKKLNPAASIVVMTAHGTMETALRAVREGAFDYLPKPFELGHVQSLVVRALQRRQEPAIDHSAPSRSRGSLVGQSLPMQAVYKQIALAAHCREPVLITGESGTGKELVARAIHDHGRLEGPFVPVHLAAMPESLVERELFGHERGAFTGAEASRPGLLDEAGRGTVLFDEVGEAPLGFQAKLLRVLDGGDYRSVGGHAEKRLAARVVAATNRDLASAVAAGQFRRDLYYRLAVLRIHLPPLRERRDDLPVLWNHFVDSLAPGTPPLDPDSPLAARLMAHDWPGNVRELRNAAEIAARASRGGPIDLSHLADPVLMPPGPGSDPAESLEHAVRQWAETQLARGTDADPELYSRLNSAVERPLLEILLVRFHGNQSQMARVLGLHRSTLRQKLRQHGLEAE